MPPRKADRALRRMVADLAALESDDIAAILDALGANERSRVERLLHDYAGNGIEVRPADRTARPDFAVAGLSPWLAERLEKSGERDEQSITIGTLAALEDCAHDLFAPEVHSAKHDKPAPSLFGRIGSLLARQGSSV